MARHEVARHEVDGEFVGETDAVLGRVRPVDVGGTGDPKLSFYGEAFLLPGDASAADQPAGLFFAECLACFTCLMWRA